MSYTRRMHMHPLCSRSFPGDAALCQRAGKPFQYARLCPRASSRCQASRPTTDWSTGSRVPVQRRTSARLSSSAVHASQRAARGVPRQTILSWMPLLESGSGSFSGKSSQEILRKARNQRWNGYVCRTAPASGVDRSLPELTACHNRRA